MSTVGSWISDHDLLAAKGYAQSNRSRRSEHEWRGEGVHRPALAQLGSTTVRHGPHRSSSAQATKHGRRWEQGQIGEGTTADSPRQSALAGKRWPGLAVMASLSKWKRMAAVLLGDFPTVVKGGTGAAQHDGAPRLVGWA
jgi:hypothetical protein